MICEPFTRHGRVVYVDFNAVEEKHRAIDQRLRNWAAWATVHSSRFVQPMFAGYRPDESFDDVYNQQRPLPIDGKDAMLIEKAVCLLPENHRWATVWCYRIKSNPLKVCKALGVSREGLASLIRDSRTMLNNRGA